jgi:hypothetical protein
LIKICQIICSLEGWPRYNRVYARTGGQSFWDNYRNQKCVIYDDFGQLVNENIPSELSEFFTLKSNNPSQLEMAHLEDKGRVFTSQIIGMATNYPYLSQNNIRSAAALHRRRNVLLEFKKVDGQAQFVAMDPINPYVPKSSPMTELEMCKYVYNAYQAHMKGQDQFMQENASFTAIHDLCKQINPNWLENAPRTAEAQMLKVNMSQESDRKLYIDAHLSKTFSKTFSSFIRLKDFKEGKAKLTNKEKGDIYTYPRATLLYLEEYGLGNSAEWHKFRPKSKFWYISKIYQIEPSELDKELYLFFSEVDMISERLGSAPIEEPNIEGLSIVDIPNEVGVITNHFIEEYSDILYDPSKGRHDRHFWKMEVLWKLNNDPKLLELTYHSFMELKIAPREAVAQMKSSTSHKSALDFVVDEMIRRQWPPYLLTEQDKEYLSKRAFNIRLCASVFTVIRIRIMKTNHFLMQGDNMLLCLNETLSSFGLEIDKDSDVVPKLRDALCANMGSPDIHHILREVVDKASRKAEPQGKAEDSLAYVVRKFPDLYTTHPLNEMLYSYLAVIHAQYGEMRELRNAFMFFSEIKNDCVVQTALRRAMLDADWDAVAQYLSQHPRDLSRTDGSFGMHSIPTMAVHEMYETLKNSTMPEKNLWMFRYLAVVLYRYGSGAILRSAYSMLYDMSDDYRTQCLFRAVSLDYDWMKRLNETPRLAQPQMKRDDYFEGFPKIYLDKFNIENNVVVKQDVTSVPEYQLLTTMFYVTYPTEPERKQFIEDYLASKTPPVVVAEVTQTWNKVKEYFRLSREWLWNTIWNNKIFIFLIGLFVIAFFYLFTVSSGLLVGMYQGIKSFLGYPVEAEAESPVGKNAKHQSIIRPKIAKVAHSEGSTDANCLDIIKSVKNNYITLYYKTTMIQGVIIAGTVAIVPYHFCQFEDNTILTVFFRSQYFKINTDSLKIVRVGKQDVCFMDLGIILPPGKDISNHFATEKDIEDCDFFHGVLVVPRVDEKGRDYDWHNVTCQALDQAGIVYSAPGERVYMREGYEYKVHTKAGDCGSLLFRFNAKKTKKIYGMHVAGIKDSNSGFSCLLPYETIFHMLGLFNIYCEERTVKDPIDEARIAEANLGFTPEGVFSIIEKIPVQNRIQDPRKSNIIHSKYFDKVFKHTSEPSILSAYDPRLPHPIDPLRKSVMKYGRGSVPFPQKEVDYITDYNKLYYKERVKPLRTPGVLSIDQALNGIPGVPYYDRMNIKTSPGYPYVHMRGNMKGKTAFIEEINGEYLLRTELLYARVNEIITQCEKGLIPDIDWVTCLKDENRDLEKIESASTRTFMIPPLDYTIVMRMYMLDFASAFYAARLEICSAVGIDPESAEWTLLFNKLMSLSTVPDCFDFKEWDGRCPPQWIISACNIINFWYGDEPGSPAANVRYILFILAIHSKVRSRDCYYQKFLGIPSGFAMTVIVNCMVNHNICCFVWRTLARKYDIGKISLIFFDMYVIVFFYGDDGIMTAAVWWFRIIYMVPIYNEYNILMTMGDKSSEVRNITFSEATFLKRGFRRHPTFPDRILAPIAKNTIYELVNWVTDTNDLEIATRDNILCALRFAYHHGKEFYCALVFQLNGAGIDVWFNDFEDHEEVWLSHFY